MCKKWIRPTFHYVNGILIEYAEKLIYSASYLLTYGMVSGCSLSVVFRMKLYIWQRQEENSLVKVLCPKRDTIH